MFEAICFRFKPCSPDLSECFKFILLDVVPFLFCKALEKHRAVTVTVSD